MLVIAITVAETFAVSDTRHTLNLKTALNIATFLDHSRLDYCNFLCLKLPKKHISPLHAAAEKHL